MAITVVRSAQTAGGANATSQAITSPAAGNTLVSFFSQSAATTPTCTGFTVNTTKAVYNASADSCWGAYKIADGTETSVAWTIGTGGTAHGVCYWEIAGAAAAITLDGSPAHTDNISANTGGLAVTTTVAGSVILIGVGGNAATGTIGNWTGTNVATNISTVSSRCFGGSFITTSTVSSTFTANWNTSQVRGMLAIALQPPAAASSEQPGLMLLGVGT